MPDPLRHEVLTGLVRKLDRQPNLIGLELAPVDTVDSNLFTWDEIHRNRDMAEFSDPDGEAHIVDNQGEIERTGEVASIREKKTIKGSTMAWLRRPGTEHQQYGLAKLRREIQHLNDRVDKREEWMVWQALHNEINYTRDGYEFKITFNIPASHRAQPSTLWSDHTNSTPVQDLLLWSELIETDSGFTADRVYMTKKVMRNLVANDSIRQLLGEGTVQEQVALTGQIQTLAGLTLVLYDAAYEETDEDGNTVVRKFVGNNDIVMLPDPSEPNSPIVERKVAPSTDPKANFRSGKFSKTWTTEDPARTNALIELNVVPVINLPEAIYVTDVLEAA